MKGTIWKLELWFILDFAVISQSLFAFLFFPVQKERRRRAGRLSHASRQAPSMSRDMAANGATLSLPVGRMETGPARHHHLPSGTGRGHWRSRQAQEGISQPEHEATMMAGWLEEKPSVPFQQCSVPIPGDKCCSLV